MKSAKLTALAVGFLLLVSCRSPESVPPSTAIVAAVDSSEANAPRPGALDFPVITPTPTPSPVPPTPTPTSVPVATPAPHSAVTAAAAPNDTLAGHESELRAAEAAYGLPVGLLGALAISESSYGAAACGFNAWGYESCQGYNFGSWAEGAAVVAAQLRHWIDVRGNLADALCTWKSGQVCAVNALGSAAYAATIIAALTP